jgi:hypothetical protein
MKSAIPTEKKSAKAKHGGKRPGAGRPATGKDPVRTMRLPDDLIASVDEWAASYEQVFMSRSEAIRRLIGIGLKKTQRRK